jgi:hypothetical protein
MSILTGHDRLIPRRGFVYEANAVLQALGLMNSKERRRIGRSGEEIEKLDFGGEKLDPLYLPVLCFRVFPKRPYC